MTTTFLSPALYRPNEASLAYLYCFQVSLQQLELVLFLFSLHIRHPLQHIFETGNNLSSFKQIFVY